MLDNRYEVLKRLGEGGFGVTYLARDTKRPSQPICVVKQLKSNHQASPDIVRLFNKEAEVLERLGEHDQIPRLLASFQESNRFYLVQEYIDGETLRTELERKRFPAWRPSEAEVVVVLREVLTVLAFVHQQGVVHRDIKPDNLMRRQDGKLIVIDFGIVKELTQAQVNAKGQITQTIMAGTPGYSPFEQIQQGNPRPASDVYALGMTAIELLTGKYPHQLAQDADTYRVIWRNSAKVSQSLGDFLDQMVHPHYTRRFKDAGTALQVLKQNLEARSRLLPLPEVAPPKIPKTIKVRPPFTRRQFLQWSGGAAGLVVMGKVIADVAKGRSVILPPNGMKLEDVQFKTVQLDDRGTINKQETLTRQMFQQRITDAVSLPMVTIPAGKFLMGSPTSEKDRDNDEGPQHEVSVPAFYMAQTLITQAQWKAVAKLPKVNIDLNEDSSGFKGDRRPVENVNWWEAQEFCDRLSKQTNLTYRLPSEAEWEYACRSATTTPFYFGETIATTVANYDGNYIYGNGQKGEYRQQTTDVATFPANAWGLYDMHGNVWEWCADHWHDNYQGAPIDGSAWLSNKNDADLTLRGGSWLNNPRNCRSANRAHDAPSNRYHNVGFRVVCRLSA